jgi:uncharacterized protein (DUF952 family)
MLIFKICNRSAWQSAVTIGAYAGSDDDRRDGFIHFSTAEQLAATAAKHFRGQADLVVVAFDDTLLGEALKWEPSRGGALFPHLYAHLDPRLALWVRPAPLGSDGVPILPAEVAAC